MTQRTCLIALAVVLAMAGCKKKDVDASATAEAGTALTGQLAEAARKAEAEAKVAALPKPDLARPLSGYQKLDDGERLMFLYLAAARLPPDYEKIAADFSSDYRNTRDSFRKQDLLAALKPQIQARIAEATQQPYAWMEVDDSDNLAGYDFQRGGFPVQEFQEDKTRYFHDASAYKLTWANREELGFAPVKDEAVAREIEAMRNDYDNKPRLKVYFFAQSADLDNKHIKAVVTLVQITDRSGRVLAEYGPAAGKAARAATAPLPTSSERIAIGAVDAATQMPGVVRPVNHTGPSVRNCGANGTVVFSCTTTNHKFVQVCATEREAIYSFGRPGAKPEMFLRAAKQNVLYEAESGSGSEHANVTFRNGNTAYSVGYVNAFFRTGPEGEDTQDGGVEASIVVEVKGKTVAEIACSRVSVAELDEFK